MRIAVVCPFSASFPGGVLRHARDQVESLAELGHDVRLLVPFDPPGVPTRLLHGLRPSEPPPYAITVGRSVPIPANHSIARLALSPLAALSVRRELRQGRFDVVHVHDPLAPMLSAAALAFSPAPIVATCHAGGSPLYGFGGLVLRPLIGRIDYRIAVSREAALAAEPALGGPFHVIPNGVRLPPAADPDGRAPHVLFVGREEARKGLPVLLRAWPGIRAETGARLRLVGVQPSSARRLLRRLSVPEDGIDPLGVAYGTTLDEELGSARMLVAPSLGRESFGLVLCEAFARATPVVASRIGGYAEVVDPGTGVLVQPGDPAALRRAIVELLGDEPRRRSLAEGARLQAERLYDWREIARRLEAVYERVRR